MQCSQCCPSIAPYAYIVIRLVRCILFISMAHARLLYVAIVHSTYTILSIFGQLINCNINSF